MRPTDGYKMEAGIGDRNGCFMVNYFSVQPALNYGFAKIDPKTPWQLPVNHPDVLKVRNELKEIQKTNNTNNCTCVWMILQYFTKIDNI